MKKSVMVGLLILGTAQAKNVGLIEVLNLEAFTAKLKSTSREGSRTHQIYEMTYTSESGRVLTFKVDGYSWPNSNMVDRVSLTTGDLYGLSSGEDTNELARGTGYTLAFLSAVIPYGCFGTKKVAQDGIPKFLNGLFGKLTASRPATYIREFGNTQVRIDSAPPKLLVSWAATALTGPNRCILN